MSSTLSVDRRDSAASGEEERTIGSRPRVAADHGGRCEGGGSLPWRGPIDRVCLRDHRHGDDTYWGGDRHERSGTVGQPLYRGPGVVPEG
ncbi:hypothetical protein C487_08929 [Natrinema pallidum DSM 3751]|uniref:Uncharacterized protein n=1 Tax=Natrinema pallidum DSM 3751 TaxID=1227495 RepID=L9YZL6_9EURY|nr:hypothetical protein C487_08929 [Natrinema pallidum DSM 3751]